MIVCYDILILVFRNSWRSTLCFISDKFPLNGEGTQEHGQVCFIRADL